MHDEEAIQMMQRASAEIKSLRRRIDVLAPKAEAYDNMAALIGLLPRPSQGMSEDIAWMFDRRVEELKKAAETADSETEE